MKINISTGWHVIQVRSRISFTPRKHARGLLNWDLNITVCSNPWLPVVCRRRL